MLFGVKLGEIKSILLVLPTAVEDLACKPVIITNNIETLASETV